MDSIDREVLEEIAGSVWETVLCEGLVAADSEGSLTGGQEDLEVYACSIDIRGAWEGQVSLQCPEPLARRVAAAFFKIDPDRAEASEVRDALAEITNMFGGLLKSSLPEPSRLGLAVVEENPTEGFRPQEAPDALAVDLTTGDFGLRLGLAGQAAEGERA